jgi:DHA1 family tetracycline resistance protein-like MFS transporter
MQNKTQKNFMLAAAPLFLVLLIDSMGLGLVFPILNSLVFDPSTHFISAHMSSASRNFLYGLTIGIFMFCWFFGAAFLGEVSDQIGRKKSILICLIGACVGYLISAMAVVFRSYTLLLLGRIVAGFTAGSQAIAQAAIVDLSTEEAKAKNLGLILFFTSLGFAIGPIIGGALSWFSFAMPFYFAASISFVNIILLMFLFNETFTSTKKFSVKIHYALEIFATAFKHEKIRDLSIVLIVMMFGWSGIYSYLSMFLLKVHHFDSMQIGLYMGLLGAGFGIGTGMLTEFFTNRFSLRQCVIGASSLVALGTLLTVIAPHAIYLWADSFLISIPMAIAYSTLLTLFSNQVDADSQGWIMGITGAVMAFAFGVNGLLAGVLANFSPSTPLIISVFCMVMSAGLMKFIFRENKLVEVKN